MPKTVDWDRFWEDALKRCWESLRRTREFHADCMHVGAPGISQEDQVTRFARFAEKWGARVNDPDATYQDLKRKVISMRQEQVGTYDQRMLGELYPEAPSCLAIMLGRLQGYSGDFDFVVRSPEYEEMQDFFYNAGALDSPADHKAVLLRGTWAPPQFVHFTVDIDQDPFSISERVLHDVAQLRIARAWKGFSAPYAKRTMQKLTAKDRPGYAAPPMERQRQDFAHDDDVFRVWDLKQKGSSDSEIYRMLWPDEVKQGKGRNTQTGEKGSLAQRVHDYTDRADAWMTFYPKLIRHQIII